MNVYKNLIILIILSFFIIFAFYEGAKRLTFKPLLLSREQEIAGFFYEKTVIVQRERNIIANLKMPLENMSGLRKNYPDISLTEALHENAIENKNLSMILVKDGQKIAIINNQVVKEGDLTGRDRVLKIAGERVLIRENNMDRWLTIEPVKSNVFQKKENVEKTSPSGKQEPSVIEVNIENDKKGNRIKGMEKWLNVK